MVREIGNIEMLSIVLFARMRSFEGTMRFLSGNGLTKSVVFYKGVKYHLPVPGLADEVFSPIQTAPRLLLLISFP